MVSKYRWRWIQFPADWYREFQYRKKTYEMEYERPGVSLSDGEFVDAISEHFFRLAKTLDQKDGEIKELKDEINKLRDELWPT